MQLGIIRGGTEQLNSTYATVSAASTWEKVTYAPTAVTAVTTVAGVLLNKVIGTGGNFFVDDFVIYADTAVDNTAPNAPTLPSITPASGQITVSWTAASGGVDNGGYMVVRGTADPTTAPNVNGVYAVGNTVASGQSVVYVGTNTSFADTGLTNGTNYYYRIYTFDKAYNYSSAVTASGAPAVPSPTITGAATATAFTTTYGTASAGQSFNISGANMSAGITITPPTGFEVSTSSTFASNVGTSASPFTVGAAGTIASTPLYVRLAATAAVSGTYNSQNIVLSSTGATPVNIGTASTGNTVTAKGLTITGLTAENKNWDNTTTATVTGTAAFSGLISSDSSLTPGGSVTWAFADANVGTNKTLNRTGNYNVSSSNYTLTQPTLTASIAAVVPSAPAITGITAGNGQLSVAFTAGVDGGSAITNYKYSLNGGALVSVGSTATLFTISGLTNGQSYAVRLYAVNTAGDSVASLAMNSTPSAPSSPTITVAPATFGSAFSTTYGTASSTQTFTVSGSTLSGDVTVTAPAGTEISLSSGSGYAGSLILTATSGSVASTTIYARLKATASAGSYNGQTFTVVSTGATTQNVGTTASGNSVVAKALTLTGLTASERAYNGLTDATVTGTPVLTTGQVVGSDDVSLSGTASYSFSTATVGTSKPITTSGLSLSGASSANYSLTLPSLSANITQAPVTITGLTAANKNYDAGTTVSVTGTVAFSGLVNSESFTPSGSVTWAFADATVGTNKTLVRTGSYSAPSSNYSLTQPSLTANISAVVSAAPTGIVITTAVVSGQLSVAFVAPANDGGSAITNYKYSTDAGSTWTAVSPAATTSPIVISGLVNGTSYNVQIRAVNAVGDGAATASTSGIPSVPPVYKQNFGTDAISIKPYTDVPVILNSQLSSSSWTTSATGFGGLAGSTGQALSLSNSGGTPTYTLSFNVAPGYQLDVTGLSYWRQRSTTGAAAISIAINGGSAVYSDNAVPTSGSNVGLQSVTGKTGLTGAITIVLTMSGASSTGTFRLDDFTLEGSVTAIPPTITINGGSSGTATAFTTTYGTTATAQTFTVSGSYLTDNIVATAPTGFQVSNDGATYGSTATFTQTGGAASGTLSVRLAATANVSGSYNSQSITLASTGATTRNITTASTGNIVSKATPTISVAPTASAITYGQTLASSTLTGGTPSTPGSFAFTTSSAAPSAGTASQNVTFTPTDGANYNTASTSASVVVNTKAITVTAAAKTKTYGAADPGLTYTITSGALVPSDVLAGSLSRVVGENVGTYAISSTLANANYNVTFVPASLTITAATLDPASITVTPPNLTYDGNAKVHAASRNGVSGFTYSYAGRNQTSYGPSDTAPTATGTYTVTVTSSDSNYTGSKSVDFTIAKATLTPLISGNTSTTYDGTAKSLNATTTPETVVNLTYDGSSTVPINAGIYEVVATVSDANYQGTATTSLVIAKAAITLAADAKSKTYGAADPALTYQVASGALVGSDALTGGLSRAAGENVGTYAISSTLGNANYDVTFVPNNLTIGRASQMITGLAPTASKTYGDADYTLAVTKGAGTSDLSFASSEPGVATVDTNGSVHIVGAGTTTLTVNQAADANYNAASSEFAVHRFTFRGQAGRWNYQGAVFGHPEDQATVTGTIYGLREGTSAATRIVIESVTGDVNLGMIYGGPNRVEIIPVHAARNSFTVTNGQLTAADFAYTYNNGAAIESDFSHTDYIPGNQAFSLSLSAGSLSFGSMNAYGQIDVGSSGSPTFQALVQQTLTVGKAAITLAADAKSKTYGAADPALTYQVASGALVGSDALTGGLSRAAGENVGTYAISSTLGNANYDVTFVPNNLTIGQADATVTWPTAAAITYGDALSSATLTGGSREGTFAFTSPLTVPNAGVAQSFEVTFTPSSANYKAAMQMVSVMVNKATPLITAVPTASAISFGQTLASSVLSGGTASVDGRFAFTTTSTAPSAGTAGQGVTFTPADTANYNNALTAVSVTVNPASLSSSDISLVPAGDGSYTATAAGVSSFTYSYAGRSANGITTSYSSATAPTAAGYYTVSATATGNYSGSKTADYFVAGPVAVADSRTKSAGNANQLIPVSELLGNDRRITSTGTVEKTGLTVTEVAIILEGPRAGAGSAARLVNYFVQFTPSSEPTDTFTYTVTDGTKTATATVTITTETQAPEFRLQIVKVGTATLAGANTTVTHDFIGVPGQTYLVEYAASLAGPWTSAGNQSTGTTGSFSVNFTTSGDVAADWNAHMFFRARLVR